MENYWFACLILWCVCCISALIFAFLDMDILRIIATVFMFVFSILMYLFRDE